MEDSMREMKPEIKIHRGVFGKVWKTIPMVSNQAHGVAKIWGNGKSITWLEIFRHGVRLMDIFVYTGRKDIPSNKTLLNKSQWKRICKQETIMHKRTEIEYYEKKKTFFSIIGLSKGSNSAEKQIKSSTPYVNGNVHGTKKIWHKNGKLWQEIPYVNGKRNGIAKTWDEFGRILYEEPYVNDEIHGDCKWWAPNGELGRISTYVNGKIHGIEKVYFFINQTTYQEIAYFQGKQHGPTLGPDAICLFLNDNLQFVVIIPFLPEDEKSTKNMPKHKLLFSKSQWKNLCQSTESDIQKTLRERTGRRI